MTKNKQLAINMIAQSIAFIVNISVNFFLTPYIINSVGKEAYSFIPLANNFTSYINIITIALNSMASRFITIEISNNNYKEANKYFNSVLVGNIAVSILITVPSVLMVLFINKILDIPSQIVSDVKLTFLFVYINLIIGLLGNVYAIATFSKNRLDLSSRRNIESNIIRAIIICLLFVLFKPKIYFITITMLVVSLYTFITNIHFTKKLVPQLKINLKEYSSETIKSLLSSGVWNSINQLSVVLLTTLDLMLTNVFLGAAAAGDYAIVKTIPNFLQSFVGIIVAVFVPEFTILYAQNKNKELIERINFSVKIMGLIITLPIVYLMINGDLFYSLWVPGQDVYKLQILSILTILPMIITGSMNTIFNVYTVTNKLKVPAIVLLITGIINTIVVIVLIKMTTLGLYAIPLVAAVIGIARNLIFTPLYASHCLHVKWYVFYQAILKGVLCSLVMMVITCVMRKILLPSTWNSFIISGGIAAIVTVCININFVFNKKERETIWLIIKNQIGKREK